MERQTGDSDVHMKLPARPDSIARARNAVADDAARLGMDAACLGDLRTVVSEAVTNAILYAYDEGEEGEVEVALTAERDILCLIVRDFGAGIYPRPERDVPSLNLGLPIIGALSKSFQLSTERGEGTELKICIPIGPTA